MEERALNVALKGCILDLQQGELEEFWRQESSVCYKGSGSCGKRIMVCFSSFCDLTPPALGFDIFSCLDLLIGYPQAVFTQTLSLESLNHLTKSFFIDWNRKVSRFFDPVIQFYNFQNILSQNS